MTPPTDIGWAHLTRLIAIELTATRQDAKLVAAAETNATEQRLDTLPAATFEVTE